MKQCITIGVIAFEAVTVCDCGPDVNATVNFLPHKGLLEFDRAEEVLNSAGSDEKLDTHHHS